MLGPKQTLDIQPFLWATSESFLEGPTLADEQPPSVWDPPTPPFYQNSGQANMWKTLVLLFSVVQHDKTFSFDRDPFYFLSSIHLVSLLR